MVSAVDQRAASRYYFPVATDSYRITSRHGDHDGIDLAVPIGTGVVSVTNGVVVRSAFVTRSDGSPSYGNLVVVRDGAGRLHYYAHLDRTTVKTGQRVRAGQTIAYSGSTGRSSGPHLHYEIRSPTGSQINPEFFFRGMTGFADAATDPDPSQGAAASAASAQAHGTADAVTAQLAGAGFSFPFDISRFVDAAVAAGQGADYAYALILQSPEFRNAYPGIFRPDGTLIMGPGDYTRTVELYRSTAALFGFNISREAAGGLIAREVSPEEFQTRARAVQTVKSNPQVFEYLRRAYPDQIRTQRDAVDWVLGRGDRLVYEGYEAAVLQASAASAGLDLDLSRSRQLARSTEGVLPTEEAERRFGEIAQQLREAGPEIDSFGLNQRDLETIQFGGPNRVQLAARAERALRQREAALTGRPAEERLSLIGGRPVVADSAPALGL